MKKIFMLLTFAVGMVGWTFAQDKPYNPDAKLIIMASQLSDNCGWTDQGTLYAIDKVLDGDVVSHFHSNPSADFHTTDMWWQADLKQSNVTAFFMTLAPRTGDEVRDKGWDQRPNKIEVQASNDKENWTQITTLESPHVKNDFTEDVFRVDMQAAYRYVRFIVRASVEDNLAYFNFSEFQMYAAGTTHEHAFVDGVCTVCGDVSLTYAEMDKDGYYLIDSVNKLNWFAAMLKAGNYYINARLAADIDLKGIDFEPLAPSHGNNTTAFRGIFDGQGHVIDNMSIHTNAESDIYVGFFSCVCNGRVENVIMRNASIVTDSQTAISTGALMGRCSSSVILNCAAINVTFDLATVGAKTKGSGGLVGYMSSATASNMINCFSNFVGTDELPSLCSKGAQAIVTNSYGADEVANIAATGELCYKLNGSQETIAWYQTIGTDAFPVLDATHKQVFANGELDCGGKLKEGASLTYANEKATAVLPDHQFAEGFCTVCGAFDPSLIVNNVYQLSTPAQLTYFAKVVNDGDKKAQAELTADIDLNNATWTPIGCGPTYNKTSNADGVDNPGFAGIFDGQGHTISNFTINEESEAVGVFGVVTGTVKNLGVINASFNATKDCRAGGIAGTVTASKESAGLVENCFVKNSSILTTERVCGGVVGAVCGGTVKGCYALGNTITGYGTRFGGIAGDTSNDNGWQGTVSSCYTDFERITSSQAGPVINSVAGATAEKLASGEVTFQLNGFSSEPADLIWYQKIGTDPNPVTDATHDIVYSATEYRCDHMALSEAKFTNNANEATKIPDHTFENGLCAVCSSRQPDFMTPGEDGYYNIEDAYQLRWFALLVNEGNSGVNARLTKNINLKVIENWPTIARYSDDAAYGHVSYGGVFDGQGFEVLNLKINVTDPIETGLFGRLNGATVKNLGIVNAEIITSAGIRAGVLAGEAVSSTLTNIYTKGNLKVETTHAQRSGISGEGHQSTLNNCWSTFEGELAQGSVSAMNNCYKYDAVATMKESGELCYKLNGSQEEIAWFQTLGDDEYPVLDKSHATVYIANEMNCDGTPKEGEITYSNTAGPRDSHTWECGICSVCKTIDMNYVEEKDGFYPISTPEQLVWFSAVANTKNNAANAKLMNDIDMTGINFTPIGIHYDEDAVAGYIGDYRGTIDGQGFVIKNLFVERTDKGEAGFIGRTTDAVVKNLGFENATIKQETLFANNTNIRAGIIAAIVLRGQIINCFTRGNLEIINGTGAKGYLVGTYLQNYGGNGQPMTSCYTTGDVITAAAEQSGDLVNCFCGEEVATKAATGELTFQLNGGQTKDVAWFQTLGEDKYPVLDPTHGKVYQLEDLTFANSYATKPAFENNFYQISKPAELNGFAELVNAGEYGANGCLTADINMEGIDIVPIGINGYKGCFNGQEHEITIFDSNSALFAVVKPGAVITNLTINGSFVGKNNTAAFVSTATSAKVTAPVADLLDVVFKEDGSAEDVSPMHNTVEHFGETSSVYYNTTYGRYVAHFTNPWGAACTSWYKVDYNATEEGTNGAAIRAALADGHTLEMLVMGEYEGDIRTDVEAKPFSAMQGGGTGFLICKPSGDRKSEWTFLPNVSTTGKKWNWTNSGIVPQSNVYYHVVGVWNKEEGTASIYVNGELKKQIAVEGNFNFATGDCNWFCIGGDADPSGGGQGWTGDVVIARAYDKPLTEAEAEALWMKVNEESINGGEMVKIENCKNKANVTATGEHTAAFVANAVATAEEPMLLWITNCENTGDITGDTQTAGFVGYGKVNNIQIDNSKNYGKINGKYHVGGFVGRTEKIGDATLYIYDCTNVGAVDGTGTSVAGFGGRTDTQNSFDLCKNEGNISGAGCVGGIVGNSGAYIFNSSNIGTIYGKADSGELKIGGLVGNAGATVEIHNSFNTGFVAGDRGIITEKTKGQAGGLIGVISQGFWITDSYNTGNVLGHGNNCGGIVGWLSSGKEFTITNCWNTGDVFSDFGENAGGIIGGASGSPTPHIVNCYNTGSIENVINTSAIAGWLGNNNSGEIKNCWNIGTITHNAGNATLFRNGGNSKFETGNNYDLTNTVETPNQPAPEGYEPAWLASGQFTALLNLNAGDQTYRQTIGTDATPVLDPTHGIVAHIGATGYATFCPISTNVIVPEGVTANGAKLKTNYVTLNPVAGNVIGIYGGYVLQGAEGYYSFIPTDQEAGTVESDLYGTFKPIEAGGNQYILAEKESVVGFYQATPETVIPAGKAYLEYTGAPVKGFFFENADGIANVKTNDSNETIYDLSGRRVEKATKGVFIVNGKKVANK
ncbi:MAG: discoidin domain-containing protein [Bacteroidaceae bacterium]|nr:discoidin domain-containing protein [Bacteroidaceae bacterium]